MPFALPLFFLFDLIAAALTFAAAASAPWWRRSAITAPVFVFVSAPMTMLLIAVGVSQFPFFSAYSSGSGSTVTFILLALATGSIVAAYLAALTCRFAFETLASRIERLLGLRPLLILQAAILSGGTLSLLVLLVATPNIAYQIWVWGPHWAAIGSGVLGALAVLACILALLRLRTPEQYLPKPLPQFLARRIYRVKPS